MTGLNLATKGLISGDGITLVSKGYLDQLVSEVISIIIGSGDGGGAEKRRLHQEQYDKIKKIVLKALVYGERKEIAINKRKSMPKIKVGSIYLSEEDINEIINIYMEDRNQ